MVNAVLMSMRLPFLVLAPACVLLGVATTLATGVPVNLLDIAVVLVGAVAAHISVNSLNEYQDYHSGLDALTDRTPFSGGSGSLVQHPDSANAVKVAAYLSLAVTLAVGSYLVLRHGLAILPLGGLGIVIILTYTQWLNRQPWLCLVAPGLAFGPLIVVGTHFALTGEYSQQAAYVSLVPFFLVNNLLLMNQFPDIEADKQVGRYHFPIAYGLTASAWVYGGFLFAAFLVLGLGVVFGVLPPVAAIALLPMAAGIVALSGVSRFGGDIRRLLPFMGLNVVAAVVTPLVLGVALLVRA
ncbi:1,4-dihydroxy-2-naphthoate octaprenyltransferase [Marinobacter zhejiangensis]|uniref:1,4-dihydroxy-2-naphthoate octaprenyltransferase n=1 Tax=Marinobacter zhejiangensis TaxID=488535 RepID=A0A1I4THJ8_9GAMM|nr:1,4-dihydroxy-2-naphthoate octaprenyltransferase [Marinobacter zhejiangensis]